MKKDIVEEDLNQIKKDLQRTVIDFPDFQNCYKSGKNKLFNVLRAYYALDPEVGYTQGMNFIVAMLLMNLHDEEDSFWCLAYIMFPEKGILGIKGKHNWRQIFVDMMPKAINLDKKLRVKLAKKAPNILIKLLEHTDGETLIPITCGTCSSIFVSD